MWLGPNPYNPKLSRLVIIIRLQACHISSRSKVTQEISSAMMEMWSKLDENVKMIIYW